MKKTAVITDSNSGITQAQGQAMGIRVVPMPFTIDGREYFEDIDLTQEQFYEMLEGDAVVSTSQPNPEKLTKLWDEVLKDNDEIVYIPMSSGLSGSCQTAWALAQESYKDRVYVVDNQRISVTQRQSVLDALDMAEHGLSGQEIHDILIKNKLECSIYIMLDTLYYLKKGGRITPAAAALGTLLKLKPVLQIQGDKLDAFAKARTVNQGKQIMLNAIKTDIETRFGGMEKGDFMIAGAYTRNVENALEWKSEVEAFFPGYQMHMDPLSLSVACHIGPGALAVTAGRKLHY